MKIDEENYPQFNLEECKYKTKRIQMSRFIHVELYLDSDDDSDLYSDDSDDDSNNDSNNDYNNNSNNDSNK